MLKLLVGNVLDAFRDFVELVGKFNVPFVFFAFSASILTELIDLIIKTERFSSDSDYLQV